MATIHYQLSTFLLKTPHGVLRDYFHRRGILGSLPFEGMKRRAAASALAAALAELPLEDRARVDEELREVFFVARRAGTNAMCDEVFGRGYAVEAAALASMENDYARALRIYLDHPDDDVFAACLSYAHARTLATGRLRRRSGLPKLEPLSDEVALRRLAQGVSRHFEREHRGERCEVSHHLRLNPRRHWFFAYPEDYPASELAYTEEGLTCRERRPVFEVAFAWHPEEGLLEVGTPGDRSDMDALAEVFRAAVLPGVHDAGNGRPLVIQRLLDPAFHFPTDPGDGIRAVEPVAFRFTQGRRSGSSLEIQRDEAEPLHAFLDRVVDLDQLRAAGLSLYSARLRVTWRPEVKRVRTTTFTLTMPDGTDLTDDPKHRVIRAYLKRWGLAA